MAGKICHEHCPGGGRGALAVILAAAAAIGAVLALGAYLWLITALILAVAGVLFAATVRELRGSRQEMWRPEVAAAPALPVARQLPRALPGRQPLAIEAPRVIPGETITADADSPPALHKAVRNFASWCSDRKEATPM